MRSRPDIKLYLEPSRLSPGEKARARVALISRSETPINGVEVRLTGRELYYSAGRAKPPGAVHTHVDLLARLPESVLTPGEHVRDVVFELPAGAPPSYRSSLTTIGYEIVVHVDIPWWPDRTARYVVPMRAVPSPAAGGPVVFCTDERGAQGTALYIESSLDCNAVPAGGAIRGAASLTNAAHHRIRRVELSLVTNERRRGIAGPGADVARYTMQIAHGAPPDGHALPFHVSLPKDAPPSLSGSIIEVCWCVEIRAVIALGSDVTLRIPFTVHPAAGAPAGVAPVARVPPVGRERRAHVWAESARRNGLACDAEEERMTLDLGATSLAVTLEARKEGGLALVAAVTWPRLGIDLAVTERRWLDAWSGGVVTIDTPGFADRFTVRGRESAQVRAFLDAPTSRLLLRFDEVAVGDESATLLSAGDAQSVEDLDAFVARAVEAARALADAATRVPAPLAMAAHLPAWRAFAASLGGQLVPGDMSIHDASFGGAACVLQTEWSKEGTPAATVVRFPLLAREPGHDAEHGERSDAGSRHLDGATQALLDGLSKQVTSLDLGEHAVEARLPAPIAEPATLEPVLAGLAQLWRRLAGGAARGPYR